MITSHYHVHPSDHTQARKGDQRPARCATPARYPVHQPRCELTSADALQRRADRMGALGYRHRPPAPTTPAATRRNQPHQRTAGPRCPQTNPSPPTTTMRHLPAYRSTQTRLRPRPRPSTRLHRLAAPPAQALRHDPHRREEGPAAADHGQNQAPIATNRDALRPPGAAAVAEVTELLNPPRRTG